MAQQNWWEADEVVAPPQAGPILGPPPKPSDIADERRKEEDQAMQRESLRLQQDAAARSAAKDAEGTESERTAGFLATRLKNSMTQLGSVGTANRDALSPSMGVEAVRNIAGNWAANQFTDESRQTVRAAEIDILDAALTLGTGAAYNKEQLEGYRESYFPQLGDEPGTIKAKQERLLGLLEAARLKAGRAAPDIEAAIAAYSQLLQAPAQETNKADAPEQDDPGLSIWMDDQGVAHQGPQPGSPQAQREAAYKAEVDGLTGIFGDPARADGAYEIAKQGISLGLSDEAAGVGGAIASALQFENPIRGYQANRDANRQFLDQARDQWGWAGTALELAGGGGAARLAPGAMSTTNAMLQGAKLGGVGGYGYGEGLQGSAVNATGGAVLGGGMGGAFQAAGNALMPRAQINAATRAEMGQKAQQLAEAGQAEGVTVNRAMVDPRLQNRVSGVDATLAGGPRVQQGMQKIERQIENRVDNLGRGGTRMEDIAAGDTLTEAGRRFIKKSGEAASAKYNTAEKLAGNAKVTPQESLRRVDDMIATLSETPTTNSKEIAFLQGIKSDLSQDLTVGGLRRMRTSLRKKISTGDLVFGEDEARVLSIMDGAADDIRQGLSQQGKTKAARAFDVADKAYAERMDYINNTVQKVIGKRNSNLGPDQIFAKFQSMSRGKDAGSLQRFYNTLNPEEQADVAATFAHELGRNNAGEFTVSQFMTQSEKLSPTAAKAIFGPEGAKSIENLRTLGAEVKRVTGAMNSRTSKTAVANNWRDWMHNLLLGGIAGGGGGAVSGSGTAMATAAGAVGVNAARNNISARLLMSPKITKWLAMAPRTATPAAIDSHFARLGAIAKAEPALAGDIKILQDAIMKAANDNSVAAKSFASDEDAKNGPGKAR